MIYYLRIIILSQWDGFLISYWKHFVSKPAISFEITSTKTIKVFDSIYGIIILFIMLAIVSFSLAFAFEIVSLFIFNETFTYLTNFCVHFAWSNNLCKYILAETYCYKWLGQKDFNLRSSVIKAIALSQFLKRSQNPFFLFINRSTLFKK